MAATPSVPRAEYQLKNPLDGPAVEAALDAAFFGTSKVYTTANKPAPGAFTGPLWVDKELWWSDGTTQTKLSTSGALTTIYDKAVAAALVADPAYVTPTIEDWFNAQASGGISYLAPVANKAARIALTAVEGNAVYQEDTGHTWTYESSAWVDRGGSLGGVSFLAPVDDSVARLALTAVEGDAVFQKDTGHIWAYETNAWVDKGGNAGGGIALLAPVADTAARLALLTPAEGNTVYQVDTGHWWSYESAAWVDKGGNKGASAMNLLGHRNNVNILALPTATVGDAWISSTAGVDSAGGPVAVGEILQVTSIVPSIIWHNMGKLTGPSAYDLAVLEGFTGTQVEWLATLKSVYPVADAAARLASSPDDGNIAYQKDTGHFWFYEGTTWTDSGGGGIKFIAPAVDEAARLALTGLAEGDTIVQEDTGHIWSYESSAWVDKGAGAGVSFATRAQTKAGTSKKLVVSPDTLRDRLAVVESELKIASGPAPTDTHVRLEATADSLRVRLGNKTGLEIYADKAPSTQYQPLEVNSLVRKDYADVLANTIWDGTKDYVKGDLASTYDTLYIATGPSKGEEPLPATVGLPTSNWTLVSPKPKADLWDPQIQYSIGDIISLDYKLYVAIGATKGNPPVTDTSYWRKYHSETSWNSEHVYGKGDLATQNNKVYISLSSNKNNVSPNANPADWLEASFDDTKIVQSIARNRKIIDALQHEVDAMSDNDAWAKGKSYKAGDVTSRKGMAYIAIVDNKAVDPKGNAVEWKVVSYDDAKIQIKIARNRAILHDLQEQVDANETDAWDKALSYKAGDLATLNGLVYVAVSKNKAADPVSNLTKWAVVGREIDDSDIADDKIWSSKQINANMSGVSKLLGEWDASTNTPTLADADPLPTGSYFIVNTDGTVDTGSGDVDYVKGEHISKGLNGLWGISGLAGPRGNDGKNAYQVAKSVDKSIVSKSKWIESLKGDSAYDVAIAGSFVGTEAEWLASLTGPTGVSLNVLPPVADVAARDLLSVAYTVADAGAAVLTVDKGEFWVWDGPTLAWMNASSLIGPTGAEGAVGKVGANGKRGLQGVTGVQGVAGLDGVSINIKPPVANEAERLAITPLVAGDSVVQLDTGEFWVKTATAWVNGGAIKGPAGPQGVEGPASTVAGPKGADGMRVRITGGTLYITTDGSQP